MNQEGHIYTKNLGYYAVNSNRIYYWWLVGGGWGI